MIVSGAATPYGSSTAPPGPGPAAVPDRPARSLCGGCDFQHADLPDPARLKRQVVAEQLQRLAGIAWAGEVEPAGDRGRAGLADPDALSRHPDRGRC